MRLTAEHFSIEKAIEGRKKLKTSWKKLGNKVVCNYVCGREVSFCVGGVLAWQFFSRGEKKNRHQATADKRLKLVKIEALVPLVLS